MQEIPMVDWSKYDEYRERGLPHVWKDGRQCGCRECKEAQRMGPGQDERNVPLVKRLGRFLRGRPKDEPNGF